MGAKIPRVGAKITRGILAPGGQAAQGAKINCYTGFLTMRLTCSCNEYPSKTPQLYSKTAVYRGKHFFLIFDPKHRLWALVRTEAVLTCTHNQCLEQKYHFCPMKSISTAEKTSLYIAWASFRNVFHLPLLAGRNLYPWPVYVSAYLTSVYCSEPGKTPINRNNQYDH